MLPSYSASTLYSTLQTAPQFGPLPLDIPVCLMRSQFHPHSGIEIGLTELKSSSLQVTGPEMYTWLIEGQWDFQWRAFVGRWMSQDNCFSFFWDSFHRNNFFSFCKLSCTNMSGPGRSQHLEGIKMKKITGKWHQRHWRKYPWSPSHLCISLCMS